MEESETDNRVGVTNQTNPPPAVQGAWWLGFTGLIPVFVAVPILIARLWAVGIVVVLVMGTAVIAYHLLRGQGVTGLDVVTVTFGAVNAVLYFGFHETILLAHIDAVIYTLLFLQVAYSLLRGTPWTVQFAKRSTDPALWNVPQFTQVNRATTVLWAVAFISCDVAALLVPGLAGILVPVAFLVAAALMTRPLARRYARHIGVPPESTQASR